ADERARSEENDRYEEKRREKKPRRMSCARRRRIGVITADLTQVEPRGFRRRRWLCESRRRRTRRRSRATDRIGRRARSRFRLGHHGRGLANRRGFELIRRIAHLPSAVVGLGALELVLRRRVAAFIALVAEIEFQIFAGVGFLLTVAEGAIERIVGFRFVPYFFGSILGLLGRRFGHAVLERLAL